MQRWLQNYKEIPGIGALAIQFGGTGVTDAEEIADNFGILNTALKGIPLGYAVTGPGGRILIDQLPAGTQVTSADGVSGPASLPVTTAGTYTITDYDSYSNYVLAANGGTVSRVGDTITYTPPDAAGIKGFTINGRTIAITVTPPVVNTPSITSPVNNATGTGLSVTAASSAFGVAPGTDTHISSQWQLASDSGFANLLVNTGDVANLVSRVFSGLAYNTAYYVRVRYKSNSGVYSAWSTGSKFTTMPQPVVSTPSITSPSNGAGNLPLGFTLYSSGFSMSVGSDTHATTHWQVARDAGFTNLVVNTGDSGSLTALAIGSLGYSTGYYVRCRYKSAGGWYSAWSAASYFSTQAPPATAAPTIIGTEGINAVLSNLSPSAYRYRAYENGMLRCEHELGSVYGINNGNGSGKAMLQNFTFNTIINATVSVYSDAGGWSPQSSVFTLMFSSDGS